MKLPRGVSGAALIKALGRLGYETTQMPAPHHVTIPMHDPLRVGTLAAILAEVGAARDVDRQELTRQLFG
jgi:hypothetical protein